MGAWINPKQLAVAVEVAKKSNSSIYIDYAEGDVSITPSRGNKVVKVDWKGKVRNGRQRSTRT